MKNEAMELINFLCREDNAMANASYIGYFSPVDSINRELVEEGELPDLLPSEEDMENMEVFHDPGDDISKFDALWTAVKG